MCMFNVCTEYDFIDSICSYTFEVVRDSGQRASSSHSLLRLNSSTYDARSVHVP